ncbi:MAG: hypothetical protein LQ338_000181 [Usnochroma carphineum]|nr:MAG: hypothetical protein LQ338_000181 [Usnochroma carphineum]
MLSSRTVCSSYPSLGRSPPNRATEVRDNLKPDNLSFTEIAKRVGEMWQALGPEEREPYEAQAGLAKEEYLIELTQYKQTSNYKEYAEYLADFKAKHPSKAVTTLSAIKPRGESKSNRLLPTSPRSPVAPQQVEEMVGIERPGSGNPPESRVQSICSQDHNDLSPDKSSPSSLSLSVGTTSSYHNTNASAHHTTKLRYDPSLEVLPSIGKGAEPDRVTAQDANPLAMLAYAGRIMDQKSRQAY